MSKPYTLYPKRFRGGFVLVYTIILVAIILTIVGIGFSGALFEVRSARSEAESLKALYAADAALECVRFYQRESTLRAFSPPNAMDVRCLDFLPVTYDTGNGQIKTEVAGDGDGVCEAGEQCSPPGAVGSCVDGQACFHDFKINDFSDGRRCAHVNATAYPRTVLVEGTPFVLYDLEVLANGKNIGNCAGTGANVVERSRWENM